MTTLRQVVETVKNSLAGFSGGTDNVTALRTALNSTALAVDITDPLGIRGGFAEIELEMVRVQSVDQQNSSLLLYPFGRGWNGTNASSHALGAEVTINPTWPRAVIARQVNDLLVEVYPRLYSVNTLTFDAATVEKYTIPAGNVSVIKVQEFDTNLGWVPLYRYTYDPDAGTLRTSARGTGQVRVTFARKPGTFDLSLGLDQDWHTVTGLDDRITALVALGVAARMAPFLDVARLPFASAEARADAQVQPYNAGASTARTLFALYQDRLNAEALALTKDHPMRVHLGVD